MQSHTFARYFQGTPVSERWPFRVVSLGRSVCPPGTPYPPPHRHPVDHRLAWTCGRSLPTVVLLFVDDGTGVFESRESGVLRIEPGSFFFLHPHVWHRYRPDPETGWSERWVEIAPQAALPLMASCGISPADPLRRPTSTARLADLFRQLLDLAQADRFGLEQELAGGAYQLLTHALALSDHQAPQARHYAVVERVKQLLAQEQPDDASIAACAVKAGLSISRLRTVFKEATGLSPKQFQLEARMDRAQRLLAETPLSVGQIAETAGFASIYHFSRQFKRMYGIAPTTWRTR